MKVFTEEFKEISIVMHVSVKTQLFHSCAIFLVIAIVKTIEGTLFISLKRLKPVYSLYESLGWLGRAL